MADTSKKRAARGSSAESAHDGEEYAKHNVRRRDPELGRMETVSTPSHPEVIRNAPPPLPDPVTFTVGREGAGNGRVVLRWSGDGPVTHAQLAVTVDADTYARLTDREAAFWDVTLTPRRSRP